MKKKVVVNVIKIEEELSKYLTEESLDEFIFISYSVGDPEGNYIEEFDRKMREGGIEVNDEYREQLFKTGCPVPGVDLRTGLYGLDFAGTGFFSAGLLFFEQKEWDKAIVNFAKAIELRPRHVLAYSMKAQCHYRKEEYLLAAAEMENSILLNPYAIIQRTGQKIPVLEEFGKGFLDELKDILVHAYYIQGHSYHRVEMFDKAVSSLNHVLELDPKRFDALELRVAAFMKSDSHYRKAVKDCDTLIANHYLEVLYLQYRAMCCRELGWYRKSIADFTAAIAMDPSLDLAYAQRAVTYFENCDFLRARADADEAIKRGVKDALYYRARANLHIGDFDEAIADFDVLMTFWEDTENIVYLRNEAEDYKKRGVTMHTIGLDGIHRDHSKKAGQRR